MGRGGERHLGGWVGPTQESSRHLKMQTGNSKLPKRCPLTTILCKSKEKSLDCRARAWAFPKTTDYVKSVRASK